MEPRYAATLSGAGNTGALLAAALGIATIGTLYVAVVGGDPARSATGLAAAVAATGGLLLSGAGCAARAVRATSGGR